MLRVNNIFNISYLLWFKAIDSTNPACIVNQSQLFKRRMYYLSCYNMDMHGYWFIYPFIGNVSSILFTFYPFILVSMLYLFGDIGKVCNSSNYGDFGIWMRHLCGLTYWQTQQNNSVQIVYCRQIQMATNFLDVYHKNGNFSTNKNSSNRTTFAAKTTLSNIFIHLSIV